MNNIKNKYIFSEKQFMYKNIWVVVLILSLLILAPILLILNTDPTIIWSEMWPFAIVIVLTSILIFTIRMETEINDDSIYFKYYPFKISKIIKWSEVDNIAIKKNNSILSYGGYGIRMTYKNKTYNISGNNFIIITLKNGNKITLGTQKPEEAENYIKSIHKNILSD